MAYMAVQFSAEIFYVDRKPSLTIFFAKSKHCEKQVSLPNFVEESQENFGSKSEFALCENVKKGFSCGQVHATRLALCALYS
jgi:hypothetical protein